MRSLQRVADERCGSRTAATQGDLGTTWHAIGAVGESIRRVLDDYTADHPHTPSHIELDALFKHVGTVAE
jgi:hypothetical protein